MAQVLVTGKPEPLRILGPELERRGFETILVDDMERFEEIVDSLKPGSIDCYIQLPVAIRARGDDVVMLIHDFLAQGLVARFASASLVMPLLRSGASVILVPGNHPPQVQTPDDRGARLALLNVLSHAVRAEKGDDQVWVRVVNTDLSPQQLADLAAHPGGDPYKPEIRSEMYADLDYAEWRLAIMSMVSGEA